MLSFTIVTRKAEKGDLSAVKDIYNQGIAERIATFETGPRTEDDIGKWLTSGYPFVVSEVEGKVSAFAATFPYSTRDCYRGIAEFSIYVNKDLRKAGLGRITMEKLLEDCELNGFWKLVSRVFTDNAPSRNLLKSLGFREVGVYEKHGKLDGKWKDTVIVEYLFQKNLS